MTTLEIIETQNEIIQLQEAIISELYQVLAQHTEMDDFEERLMQAEELKEKIT